MVYVASVAGVREIDTAANVSTARLEGGVTKLTSGARQRASASREVELQLLAPCQLTCLRSSTRRECGRPRHALRDRAMWPLRGPGLAHAPVLAHPLLACPRGAHTTHTRTKTPELALGVTPH